MYTLRKRISQEFLKSGPTFGPMEENLKGNPLRKCFRSVNPFDYNTAKSALTVSVLQSDKMPLFLYMNVFVMCIGCRS